LPERRDRARLHADIGDFHDGTIGDASRPAQSHPVGLGPAAGQRRGNRRHPVLGGFARCR